jgi:nicotinamidase-related amidase
MPSLDPKTTALVLIDLQTGIVGMDLAPRTGGEVVETATALAARFRSAGAPVVLVHVSFADGLTPPQNVDAPMGSGNPPADWSDFVAGVRQEGDIVVLKHHWGAFTGTDLDLVLRRRGVKTIVLGGIATNFGVESTARSAWEHGYDVVLAEDACTSAAAEAHAFAVKTIFPRISRVVTVADVTLA